MYKSTLLVSLQLWTCMMCTALYIFICNKKKSNNNNLHYLAAAIHLPSGDVFKIQNDFYFLTYVNPKIIYFMIGWY